ncbi:MAG: GNAT family N-acetyltransferase [Armatimonadota bacterium]
MIIRNLDADECHRLAEIDPSFVTNKTYRIDSENPFEPRLVAVDANPPIEVMPPIFGSTSPNAAMRYFDEYDRYDLFLAAEEDNRIVGAACCMPLVRDIPFCMAKPGEYMLATIAVDREERGKGIGRQLLETVKRYCVDSGKSMVSLWTGFDYYPAVKFYLSQGFAISGWMVHPGCYYDECMIYLTWKP